MSVPYNFTPDDQMNPVYCVQCRAHIPMLVSVQYNGICPDCLLTNQQAAASKIAAPAPARHSAVPIQSSQPDRSFLPYFIFSLFVTILVIAGSLAYYHCKVVAPLEAKLMAARRELSLMQTDISNTRQQLSEAKREVAHTRESLGATQEHLDSLTGTVNHNAEAENYNNSLR